MGDTEDPETPDMGESLPSSRSRRQNPRTADKKGRKQAFERLRELKGAKHKYEVSKVDDVYEEVDEREYSKRRQDKLQDDWIVDDDGSGYVEDGREIFESDDDEGIFVGKKEKVKHSKSKSSSGSSKKVAGNIKNLLINMPSKKKKTENNVGLEDDELLGDILQDLNQEAEPIKLNKQSFQKKKVLNKPLPMSNCGSVNPFSMKLSTTPVRIKESPKVLKPRSITSENFADVPESPKAKRSLDIKEETKEHVHVDDFDTMDMMDGFDDFDNDMEDIENVESNIVKADVNKEVKQEPKMEVKIDNRGFTINNIKLDDSSMSTGWETIKGSVNEDESLKDVQVDSSQLPLTTLEDGSHALRMYWLDAYEDYYKQPGIVYLFGKVWIESAKSYVSCCLQVKNILRRVFLLPRQKKINLKTKEESEELVKIMEVYQEFNDVIAKKFKILQFKSKISTKRYAFEKFEVPAEAEYLEIRYSPEYPSLPSDLCGETFSHVFGTNTPSLEMFLLDRKIKGPSWIEINLPQLPSPPVSWCKVEAVALNPSHVTPICGIAVPPVVIMAIGLQTTINPKTHQNEIAMVSSLVHTEFPLDKAAPNPPFQQHFCTLTHPADVPWPWDFVKELPHYNSTKIEKMDTERALLGFLLAKIHKIDPDLVVGHDILGFDLSVLLHRINHNKIPHWSRLGRLKRTQMMKLTGKGYAEKMAMCGRLVCDVKLSAKELIRAKSYDLGPLVGQILREPESQRQDLSVDEVKKMYDSSKSLLQLVTMTMQDTSYILRILCELNALPLALQITNIAGNVMSRTLLGGRSERNEFLLLHAFTEKNFISPDKQYAKTNMKVRVGDDDEEADSGGKKTGKGKRKAAYAGGLVLEPKKGFYDKYILLMDFNSLYPSIIQEYNICFTTMERVEKLNEDEDALPSLPEADQEAGVLPTEIRKLVESRKQVKQLMKQANLSSDLKLQYDIRQKALKLTANSMYGCLGFQHSRFYAKHLAALVTSKGREILLHTRDLVQKLNFDVIYGDTDSIMINTNCTDFEQVFTLGQKIKSEVNKLYKLLELDVDGVYKYMLLLKKKKYAALTVSRLPNGKIITEQELKGLDIVRRDWSQLASDAGKHILQQILSDQSQDDRIANIHLHLEELKSKLDEGKFSLDILAITKQLTKNPEDYPDKKSLPHVQVALRLNSRGGKKLRSGDTVDYVICDDGSNLAATQRAYHVDELKNNSKLTVDKNYYLAHQMHPVISRLCDPIEGTDSARIAECLGLDPSGYRVSKHGQSNEDEEFAGTQISDEERYRMCERFQFKCPSQTCDTLITMDSAFRGVGTNLLVALDTCPTPACKFEIYSKTGIILNKLRQDIRRHISAYYSGWLMCEDPGCNNRTRRIPLRFSRGFPICNLCERGVLFREYTESQLYMQLCFYDYIFDFHKACIKHKDIERIRNDNWRKAYNILHNEVQKHLNLNAYSEVNLTRLFGALFQSG